MTTEVTPEVKEVVPGSPEYDAQMAALADASQNPDLGDLTPENPEGTPEVKPEELIGGKFKSVDELLAAYQEATKAKEAAPAEPAAAPSTEQVEAELADKGLNFVKFQTEVVNNGALSDASYEELAKAGITREVADAYIEGQRALGEQRANTLIAEVGGDEVYAGMAQWAQKNLSAQELSAYNRAVNTDEFTARLAVQGLYSKFVASQGTDRPLIGGTTAVASTDVYESTSQMVAAMRDPRYKTDPAYRRAVAAKVGRSNLV